MKKRGLRVLLLKLEGHILKQKLQDSQFWMPRDTRVMFQI
nr:hypothetical protein Iba_scaffold35182CG0050 [Ipomoea batatas]GMC94098.1 hypothetical protein Iba_scaffold37431CG0010 [Ipomoea batatas]